MNSLGLGFKLGDGPGTYIGDRHPFAKGVSWPLFSGWLVLFYTLAFSYC
jgi:hypothetical protein